MSAHTHAPVPVDFIPMRGRQQIEAEIRLIAARMRECRNRLSLIAQQMEMSPWFADAEPLVDDLEFAAIPRLEEACALVNDVEDRL